MVCPDKFKLALFVTYIVAIVSALANPADINYEDAYLATQGANVATLLVLAYCKRQWPDAFIAAWLGVAFALRATGSWEGGSRWDSLLVTLGMLIVLQHAFYTVVPKRLPHKLLVYLGFSCLVMPVLSALPHIMMAPRIERHVLMHAANLSQEAYGIVGDGGDSSLWTVRDAGTDTKAGVRQVGDDIFVYFAGTTSTTNWKTNVNILGDVVPAEWGCTAKFTMRTHKGFTKAFESVAPKMLAALVSRLGTSGPNARIVFCGHSLGGALATMAGLFVSCKLPAVRSRVAVVSFGAPQVGDGNFVKFFNEVVPVSVRVVNPLDPVPRILQVQLVHVKGYYPVGALTLDSTFKAHNLSTYIDAINRSRLMSIVGSVMPAVVVASVLGLYIAWQLRDRD